MKTIICLILVSTLALTSGRPQVYNNKQTIKSYNQPTVPTNVYKNASPSSSSSDKESQILSSDINMKGDGTYRYDFQTSNGIKRTEQGTIDGTIQGFSSYISPEGIEVKTSYVADETGYHPVGDHIPQIPDSIVRALDYIRTHPYIEKDYYTGEVKPKVFNTNQKQFTHTTVRSAYNKGSNSKYNFRH